METVLGRQAKAADYKRMSKRLGDALIAPLPMGYWNDKDHRIMEWDDREGKDQDHNHLLANALPVLFGYAAAMHAVAVRFIISDNAAEFERFPSFLSAKIAEYS